MADKDKPGNELQETRAEQPDPEDRDDRPERPERGGGGAGAGAAAATSAGGGFFHIYKPGQGYWTRLGTAISVALLLVLVAQWLFNNLRIRLDPDARQFPVWSTSIVSVLMLAGALFLWHYLNKPRVVDFFIATESEMKKVNWTSRKDLIGSTKVVIFFMFLIAAILFVIDLFFGYFFYLIRVLHNPPF